MFSWLKKKFYIWFMQTRVYQWFLLDIMPHVKFRIGYTLMKGFHYRMGYAVLEPGDIILSIDYSSLTGKMITNITGGKVAHASVCVGKGGDWEVSEMTHHHYTKSTFFDICKEADAVWIMDVESWTQEYRDKMVAKCKSFVKAKYDLQFTMGINFLSCSELAYHTDFEHTLEVDLEDIAKIGRPYISPEGLRLAKNGRFKFISEEVNHPFKHRSSLAA